MPSSAPKSSSYGQILKSSSIIGGAQGLNYLIGMFRTKMVAVLLGPAGVGLVGLFQSATALLGAISGLGIGSSGIREIAASHGKGDAKHIAITVRTLRRACWVTGIFGWIITAAVSYPLSVWTFGSDARAGALTVLGITLLLAAINGGQTALLQGTRRVKDLAKINVLSALAGTIISIGIYAVLGERGIVPVLIISAFVNIGFSWWFARKIEVPIISLSWRETWTQSKRFLPLGIAFMLSALTAAASALLIRGLIVRYSGIEANGFYQAAWGLSGMFAGFILSAMGTDFYPRLTEAADDNLKVKQLVNEQIEIGLLLALPGILATLAFAPWAMSLFYSAKFLAGAELLPWFILGVFGRVTSWPLGYILLAKGSSRWFAFTESFFAILHVGLAFLFLKIFGLLGVAVAFAVLYAIYNLGMVAVASRLIGFRWSKSALKLLFVSCILVTSGFVTDIYLPVWWAEVAGGLLTLAGTFISLRGISSRLGAAHRFVILVCRFPGGRHLCGI